MAITLIFPAYERLVKYDGGKTEVIPELAESWTTAADNLKLDFQAGAGTQVRRRFGR